MKHIDDKRFWSMKKDLLSFAERQRSSRCGVNVRYSFPIFDASKTNTVAVLSSQRQTTNIDVTLLQKGRKEKCTSLSRRYEVARIQRGVLSGVTRLDQGKQ